MSNNELAMRNGENNSIGKVEESRAIAEMQAKMLLAKKFPRDDQMVLDKILKECGREKLAEDAIYSFSRGDSEVKGASIRLAETIARHWGNFLSGVTELEQKDGESTVKSFAWDLESNFADEKIFTVSHIRNTKKGSYKLTDSRDIYEKVANDGARRKRACMLAVIPGWVVDEAIEACQKTLEAKISPNDIEATKTKLLEAFKVFADWIDEKCIADKIGKDFDKLNAKDIVKLRNLYNAIKDGFVKVDEAFGKAVVEISIDEKDLAKIDELNEQLTADTKVGE